MKAYKLFFIIVALVGFGACDSKKCNTTTPVNDVVIRFQTVDKAGAPIIGDYWKKYDQSEVKFQLSSGKAPALSEIYGEGNVYFNLVEPSQTELDTVKNDYYLVLPPIASFPYEDIDTVQVFMILQRIPDCYNPILEQLKVSFNDSLYYSGSQLPGHLIFYKI